MCCAHIQDARRDGSQLAFSNRFHWLCSLLWRSLHSWYKPNDHNSEKSEPGGSFMAIVTNKPRRNLGTFMDNSFNRSCTPYLFPQPLFWSWVQKKRPNGPFRHVTGHWTPVPHPITSFPSLHTLLVPPIGFPIFTRVSYLHSLYGSFYDFSNFIFALD